MGVFLEQKLICLVLRLLFFLSTELMNAPTIICVLWHFALYLWIPIFHCLANSLYNSDRGRFTFLQTFWLVFWGPSRWVNCIYSGMEPKYSRLLCRDEGICPQQTGSGKWPDNHWGFWNRRSRQCITFSLLICVSVNIWLDLVQLANCDLTLTNLPLS